LHNGVTKVCPNCGRVRPFSYFEDKSLITGVGKICVDCKAESKRKKDRRKYDSRKARKKSNTKIVVKKDPEIKKPDRITILKGALDNHMSVNIMYKKQRRTIDPYVLDNTYVIAYCHNAHDIRTFRIDRIQHALVLSEGFSFDKNLHATATHRLKQAPYYHY
jgi:predicted DNA-binding transcriptional regulator YafY